MLKSLKLQNFTVFPDADFKFGKNLNIIIGENGLGKTHILKAAYCIQAVSARGLKETGSANPTKAYLQIAVANKLRGVFRPDELGRLARRQAGRSRAEVTCHFEEKEKKLDLTFSLNSTSKTEVVIDATPSAWSDKVPIYLPTREMLSIYPGFVSLYETAHIPFEETWRDLAILLGAPLAKGTREKKVRKLLELLEVVMGGQIDLDGDRFYLVSKSGRIEMHLVAEGMRKLAMLARLMATGSLLDKGTLFWDEPEANLNPKLVKLVARTILELSARGIQVFVASHSLFLLRELFILQQTEYKQLDTRCFGLHDSDKGVTVRQGPTMDDVGEVVALDEDLLQSERYMETFSNTSHHAMVHAVETRRSIF